MIGYYVHHVGQGHAHRAVAVAVELRRGGTPVTGLSSLAVPAAWPGPWYQLPPDDTATSPVDPSASGRLHWVPLRDPGLRARMGLVSEWIARTQPAVIVSDLSVEITVLARLHGIPVITTVLPGRRDDAAHQLAFDLAELIVAPWPALTDQMCPGLERHRAKVIHVGGLSRFDAAAPAGQPRVTATTGRRLLIFGGAGHRHPDTEGVLALTAQLDDAHWHVRQRGVGEWTDDPWPDLCAADVVITHAGLGTVSDIAAAQKPAVVVAEPRPHEEQAHTAAALHAAGLGVVLEPAHRSRDWPAILDRALALDPRRWREWSPGDAACRFAEAIRMIAERRRC